MTIKQIVQSVLQRVKYYIDSKIEEINTNVGEIESLNTENKNSIVEAVNELCNNIENNDHDHDDLYVNKNDGGTFEGEVTFNGPIVAADCVLPNAQDPNSCTIGSDTSAFGAIYAGTLYENGKKIEDEYMGLHKSTVDLTDPMYDQFTWYPCVSRRGLERKGLHRIICSTQLNGSKPSWASHANGFTCICDVLQTAGGWGITDGAAICLNSQCRHIYDNQNPCGYKHLYNASKTCFWLRGGGRYDMYTQEGTGWDIYTEPTEISSITIQPETSWPGIQIDKRSSVYANIAGYITESMVFNNNLGIKGRNTSGDTYDICGVDSNNKIYIGWGNQVDVHHNNFTIFKQPVQFDNAEFGSMNMSMYGNPERMEFVWKTADGTNWDWDNKFYMTKTGQFYAARQVSVGGHRLTWTDNYVMSILNGYGNQFSTVEVKDLKLGNYNGVTRRLSMSASAPSNPVKGDVWIQNN